MRRRERPTLGVVVTGGIGVLVVVAFVAAIVIGREERVVAGDRVAVNAASEPGLPPVALVARCPDERVQAVEVRTLDGVTLWRVESEKGTIDRAFVVGGEPPALFDTVVNVQPWPAGPLEVVAEVDGVVDRERFDPADLGELEGVGAPCDDGELGLVPFVFVLGAIGVVAAYAVMVARYVRRP